MYDMLVSGLNSFVTSLVGDDPAAVGIVTAAQN